MKRKGFINRTEGFLIGIIFLYCAAVTIVNPAFLSFETLFDILRSSAVTMIMAAGIMVVIISGGIDVSFTAVALFGAYVTTKILTEAQAPWIDHLGIAFLCAVTMGVLWGLFNAVLVHKLKLPAFIITLGTQNLIFGIMTTFIGSKTYGAAAIPKAFSRFASAQIFQIETGTGKVGVSCFVIPMILVLALTWFIMYKTKMGRSIFALGNSESAARRIGIDPFRVRLFVYAYMGALAGVAGIVYVSQVKCMYPNALVGDELSVIAAAVIGGTKLSGGQGKLLGAFLGVMIVHLLNNTLIFLGLSSSWNNFFVGALMIVSVSVTAYQERIKNRRHFIFTE
ncbi:MAG: ABC transporter permease [Eubacteriales bacterium]|nr:ABC transporter permease [Eubacteriales bacterium]